MTTPSALIRNWTINGGHVALALLIGFVTGIGLQVLNQGQSVLLDLQGTLKQHDLTPLHRYLENDGFDRITKLLQEGLITGLGLLQTVFSGVFTGIFGAVINFYMLIDGDKLWKVFLTDTTAVIFPFFGVKYSLILAVIVGVLDVIPGIGATLGIVVISVMVFASQGAEIALRALIASLLLGQIQNNVIRPRVMGKAMELNQVILFLSLFIGQRVAGLLGVFLSIPIAGMIALWIHSERQEQEPLSVTPGNDS